ncbi:hypothetical protein Pcac1_g28824 [Phytophthora cactorum]|nr:hypothetical protein Pcac1_g28824 [Phytophthora cactorum]
MAVHHAKKPGKRRRLRVPEAQVNRRQVHQATLKTRSVLIPSRAAAQRPRLLLLGSRTFLASPAIRVPRSVAVCVFPRLGGRPSRPRSVVWRRVRLRFFPRITPRSSRQIHGFGIRRQLPLLHRAFRRHGSSPALQRLRLDHRSP